LVRTHSDCCYGDIAVGSVTTAVAMSTGRCYCRLVLAVVFALALCLASVSSLTTYTSGEAALRTAELTSAL
jgi:hypothetical protein